MSEPMQRPSGGLQGGGGYGMMVADRPRPESLDDVLERVLDKGIIIAGDIRINLLEIELLTIKLRLLIVSVDKAAEMGINWWKRDPMLTTDAQELAEENEELRNRIEELEAERE